MIQHPTCLLTRELLRSCAVLSLRNLPEGREPNFNSFIEMENFRRLSRIRNAKSALVSAAVELNESSPFATITIGVRPSDGEAEVPPFDIAGWESEDVWLGTCQPWVNYFTRKSIRGCADWGVALLVGTIAAALFGGPLWLINRRSLV
jgi:hypothetical protein